MGVRGWPRVIHFFVDISPEVPSCRCLGLEGPRELGGGSPGVCRKQNPTGEGVFLAAPPHIHAVSFVGQDFGGLPGGF